MEGVTVTSRFRGRAARVVLAIVAACSAGFIATAGPALADNAAGELNVYGPGVVYTGAGHIVSLAAPSGSSVTFHLKIINDGVTPSQYLLATSPSLVTTFNGWSYSVTFNGAQIPSSPATPPWETPVIAGGKSIVVLVTVTNPTSAASDPEEPGGLIWIDALLYSHDGTRTLSTETMITNVPRYPGTDPGDLFLRNGTQPFVGGEVPQAQFMTAPTMTSSQRATFTIRAQNDSSSAHTVTLGISDVEGCLAQFPVRITDVSRLIAHDDTSAFETGMQVLLPAHAHRDFTMTVSAIGPRAYCTMPPPSSGGAVIAVYDTENPYLSTWNWVAVNLVPTAPVK